MKHTSDVPGSTPQMIQLEPRHAAVVDVEGSTDDTVENEVMPSPTAERRPPAMSVAALIRGHEVAPTNALIGAIAADEVRLERAVAGTVIAGERAELRQVGARLIVAGGDVTLSRGGAQAVIARGAIHLTQGGAGIAAARHIEVGERGVVVVALAPSLTAAGGRILVGPVGAIALVGALVAFVIAAVTARRRTRRA